MSWSLKRRIFASVVLGALGLLLLHTTGRLLRVEWMTCLLWLVPLVFLAEMTKSVWRRSDMCRPNIAEAIPAVILFAFLVLHLFSSGVDHRWFYFLKWIPEHSNATYYSSVLVRFVFLSALLFPFFLFGTLKPRPALLAVLVFSQVACLYYLFSRTGGEALYRDDHPSFMFRLLEFSRTYPQLVNYNPYWNGGTVGYVEATTGTGSLGILLWPLWRFVPVHMVYTYAVAFLFIVFVPLVAAGSLRIMGARWTAGICAGILGLGVSQHFFLWLLNYGTVGSCFSLCFVVPLCACVFRVVWLGKTEKWLAVVLVLSAFFLLQWPPGAIMASPLVLSFLVSARKWSKRKIIFLSLCGLVVLVLYLRTVLLFLSVGSSHMDYVLTMSGASETESSCLLNVAAVARGWEHLLAHLREGHPLLVFLGILGVFTAPWRSVRRWYIPMIVCLALATGWGRELFPKLEVSRMALPLMFVAIVPAALLSARIMRTARHRLSLACAGLVALLLLGGWNVARLYGNKGRARYVTMSERVQNIIEWIKDNTPHDGRILFAGPAVHVYGGGHTAYLPVLTGREMICCDYYHFPTETTEYEMPPRSFHNSPEDIFEYMDLYNVTHIVTYHERWKKSFRAHPEQYEEKAVFEGRNVDMSIFRVQRASSRMHKGTGRVTAGFNVLDVQLDTAQDDVVLKYNWIDGMSVPEPVELYRFPAGHGVELIGIRPHGRQKFQLRYRRWL